MPDRGKIVYFHCFNIRGCIIVKNIGCFKTGRVTEIFKNCYFMPEKAICTAERPFLQKGNQ